MAWPRQARRSPKASYVYCPLCDFTKLEPRPLTKSGWPLIAELPVPGYGIPGCGLYVSLERPSLMALMSMTSRVFQ